MKMLGKIVLTFGAMTSLALANSSTLFPSTAIWYQDISNSPVDSESEQVVNGVNAAGGFGHGNKMHIDFSIEVLHVDATVQRRTFTPRIEDFFVPDCDNVPIPVPPGGRVEGFSNYHCVPDPVSGDLPDCHLI